MKLNGLSPSVLKALRESSGYIITDVARRLKIPEKEVKAVEEGKSYFTLTQIKKLAEIHRCPLDAFFSNTISELPTLTEIEN